MGWTPTLIIAYNSLLLLNILMKTTKQQNANTESWISKLKENASWVLSLLTIIGLIFGVGRWSASLEYKAELNANNARHFQEIATLKEEHVKELLKLETEKIQVQNELAILKSKIEKEVGHE